MKMEIQINSPMDMHLHLRDGDMLKIVAPLTANFFSWAIIMPNLVPPIKTKQDIIWYKQRIRQAVWNNKFEPYMSIFFHDWLDYDILDDMKDDISCVKLYPAGITTNSEWWVESIDIDRLWHIFDAMSKLSIPLCIHWETNGFVMDREAEFVPVYKTLAKEFPWLMIIMEHITTKALADLLDQYDNLFATVTAHHLWISLDDVIWGMMNPHNFCKPIAKRYEDRTALINLAVNWHPKLMLWTDSAPHPQQKKECCGCAAWVFTWPIALQLIAELFEKHGKLYNMQKFVSDNAINIYNLNPPIKLVKLEKWEFIVPTKYWEVIPFKAWEKLSWKVTQIT